IAVMKALKPFWLMRTRAVSMTTSSAARTAASRTKFVRDRPRRSAARSIMAISLAGNRIDNGWFLFLAPLAIARSWQAAHVTVGSAFYNTRFARQGWRIPALAADCRLENRERHAMAVKIAER